MALYNVGDRVVVRDDLVLNEYYWMLNGDPKRDILSDSFVKGMDKFLGQVVTIRSFNGKYQIKEYSCNWTDEMFFGLEEDVFGSQVDIDQDALDAVLQ